MELKFKRTYHLSQPGNSLWHLSSAELHWTELERDQFRQSLEVERAHHTEELGTIQSTNE